MSNGDDVLDNWEEIDEAGLTDTLKKIQAERKTQQEQSYPKEPQAPASPDIFSSSSETSISSTTNFVGDFQQMKLLQRSGVQTQEQNTSSSSTAGTIKSPLDDMASSFQPVMMVLHKTADEYQSANYTQPINSQTVKILRRPTQSTEPRNNGLRPRQPIKTLQQREQEYAEARLRILGSAKNPDDDVGASNVTPLASSSSSSLLMQQMQATATATSTTPTTTMAKVNCSPRVLQQQGGGQNMYNSHYSQQHFPQQQLHQHNYYYQQQQQQQQSLPSPQQQSPAYHGRTLTIPPQQQQQQAPHQQTWSPVVGGSVSMPTLRQQKQESILRMPRGPDGSTGFQMRR